MGINQLVPRKQQNLKKNEEKKYIFTSTPIVKYSLVDSSKYSFEYKVDEDVDVSMYESDRTYDANDFIDADFSSEVNEKDYSYYAIAVVSGVITGALSHLKLSSESLEKINEWKQIEWDNYLVQIAEKIGFKKKDAKDAIEFLKKRVVTFVDESLEDEVNSSVTNVFNQLSSHPSIAGLVFSIFTQYSGKKYSFGDNGIIKEQVPDYYTIGQNAGAKVVYGILYWIFDLALDTAVSKKNILDDIKLPKEFVNLLKKLYKLPLFKDLPHTYEEAEKDYSKWILKIFEKSNYQDENGDNQMFDLMNVIGLGSKGLPGSLPVLVNECIVRTFYFIKQLIKECKEKNITSFKDLNKIEAEKVLPFNNRIVSKMVLISSSCFVGINVAGIVVKNLKNHMNNAVPFAHTLLTEVSIAGIGRFVFAVIADSKYWHDDIKIIFQRREKNKKVDERAEEEKIANDMMSNDAFDVLSLTQAQTRALYSLENLVVIKDIEHTDSSNDKEKKTVWLHTWRNHILEGMGIDSEEYFVTDEKLIYDTFYTLEQSTDNMRWFYLMAMELVLFNPYSPLGSEKDNEFKKLHCEKYNYVDDQFIRRQTIISQAEIDEIRQCFKKYKNVIRGNTKNAAIAVGVTTVTALATGGLALTFAPGIATLIAGEAVAGLHGAALTSASLAFVGGGSIAAGGLGMAGGTAIITGGGALLGIAGAGSTSMAAILTQTSCEYWLRQTTKMLVFCKCVLKDKLGLVDSIKKLSSEMKETIHKVESNIKEIEGENCSLDKEVIKSSKNCLKYLNKCKSELDKMLK